MEFINLPREYKAVKSSVDRAIEGTLQKGKFILGRKVARLESKIASLANTKYAIGLNSGTDALFLALKAMNISRGDEVITTPFSFVSTAEIIANCGAKPVFVDIDPDTFNIDSRKIERAITKKTKVIIPVHLFGQMADMSEIVKIARKHKLQIIEDAAQALGAKQKINGKWRPVGGVGDTGCFSFFPTKNLGAYGDAGMVTTNNKYLADKIRLLRNHGSKRKYYHEILGFSSRLDEIQAAILLAKLPYLKEWNNRRRKIAAAYSKELGNINGLKPPVVKKGYTHVFHQYTIRTPRRNELKSYLEKKGIPTSVHYPLPLHLQPAFKCLKLGKNSFPESEKAAGEVLSLPIYPGLKSTDQNKIIKAVRSFFA